MLGLGDFDGVTEDDLRARIAQEYEVARAEVDGYAILAASGWSDGYEEGHWFLLRRLSDGALMENDSGHCSCYGFEGQWSPTEANAVAMLARKSVTWHVPDANRDQLRALIAGLVAS